jgi:hypothetical protein
MNARLAPGILRETLESHYKKPLFINPKFSSW